MIRVLGFRSLLFRGLVFLGFGALGLKGFRVYLLGVAFVF